MFLVPRRYLRLKRALGAVICLTLSLYLFILWLPRRTIPKKADDAIPLPSKIKKSQNVHYLSNLNIDNSTFVPPGQLYNDHELILLDMKSKSILHKKLFERLYLSLDVDHNPHSFEYQQAVAVLKKLEDTLYPISRKAFPGGVKQLYDSFKGRGIVYTSGIKHFTYTYHSIQFLRYLNCTLPIELFYNGEKDLPVQYRRVLSELPGLTLIDMSAYIKENCSDVQGWSLKPLAMLFTKFREIIFLDSDVLFFHDPKLLYDWRRYKSTGSLYFRDRTLPGDWIYRFTDLLIPDPSILAQQNRVFNRLSVEEGESGVIALDKHRGGTFVLLLASLMNINPYRTILEKDYKLEGDKETFWTANEMLKIPYAWGPGAGGSIGYHFNGDVKSVCGCLYHSDEDWKPSWFNGGLVKYKWADKPELMNFTHIGVDRSFTQVKWALVVGRYINCIVPHNTETDVMPIPEREKKLIDKMFEFWHAVPQVSQRTGTSYP